MYGIFFISRYVMDQTVFPQAAFIRFLVSVNTINYYTIYN